MSVSSRSSSGFAHDAVVRARSGGYVLSIVINIILLYVAQHLLEWNLGWITSAWLDAVWAVSLSLVVSIVANALFLVYDAPWFHHSVEAVATAAALFSAYWMYLVFPFEFGPAWNPLAHLVLLAMVMALTVATIVIAVLAIVELMRAGWRHATTFL